MPDGVTCDCTCREVAVVVDFVRQAVAVVVVVEEEGIILIATLFLVSVPMPILNCANRKNCNNQRNVLRAFLALFLISTRHPSQMERRGKKPPMYPCCNPMPLALKNWSIVVEASRTVRPIVKVWNMPSN